MKTQQVRDYLKSLAEKQHLTEFARHSGISYSTLQKIVFGSYPNVKCSTAEKIEEARGTFLEHITSIDYKDRIKQRFLNKQAKKLAQTSDAG